MVCELLTCCTNKSGERRPGCGAAISVGDIFIPHRFPGNGAPFTLNGRRARPVTRL
jgi:hypothetical protein